MQVFSRYVTLQQRRRNWPVIAIVRCKVDYTFTSQWYVCLSNCLSVRICALSAASTSAMETAATATVNDGDRDSGVGSLNGGQSICIYIPKLDTKVTTS